MEEFTMGTKKEKSVKKEEPKEEGKGQVAIDDVVDVDVKAKKAKTLGDVASVGDAVVWGDEEVYGENGKEEC